MDYYTRIEQQRSTNPSEQMLAALARGLRLSLDERDHLFRLGGHPVPERALRTDHVDAGIMRILDRLADTPAMVVNGLGETLLQTPPAVALLGDETSYDGLAATSSTAGSPTRTPAGSTRTRTTTSTAGLHRRPARGLHPRRCRLAGREIVETLLAESAEFREVWAEHEVGIKHTKLKRFRHPEVGDLELHCQTLYDVDQSQALLVFTAVPGTESHEKLALLTVLGAQRLAGG